MNPPARTRLSAETRAAIGLTDTVEAALDGLTAAKQAAVEEAVERDRGRGFVSIEDIHREAATEYLARYVRERGFSNEELLDLVWEAGCILDQRPAPGAET